MSTRIYNIQISLNHPSDYKPTSEQITDMIENSIRSYCKNLPESDLALSLLVIVHDVEDITNLVSNSTIVPFIKT